MSYIDIHAANGSLWIESNAVDVPERLIRVYYTDDLGVEITKVESQGDSGVWHQDRLSNAMYNAALELIQQHIDDEDASADSSDDAETELADSLGYN